MMTGMLDATAVTVKEFMLTPNMPRFVRVGDKTRIAAGIANLTGKEVKGTAVFDDGEDYLYPASEVLGGGRKDGIG